MLAAQITHLMLPAAVTCLSISKVYIHRLRDICIVFISIWSLPRGVAFVSNLLSLNKSLSLSKTVMAAFLFTTKTDFLYLTSSK